MDPFSNAAGTIFASQNGGRKWVFPPECRSAYHGCAAQHKTHPARHDARAACRSCAHYLRHVSVTRCAARQGVVGGLFSTTFKNTTIQPDAVGGFAGILGAGRKAAAIFILVRWSVLHAVLGCKR